MSWWDDVTGATAKKQLKQSNAAANSALATGFDTANQQYDQAEGAFNPYVQSGTEGLSAYHDALGLNGQEGSDAALARYQTNPMFQEANNLTLSAIDKRYNANGQADSGASRAAIAQAGVTGWNSYADRLRGLSENGLQATGAQAGVTTGQGDLAMNYGATKAGNAINYGNAMGQASQIGINNLINAVGAATNAYSTMTGMPKPPQRARA